MICFSFKFLERFHLRDARANSWRRRTSSNACRSGRAGCCRAPSWRVSLQSIASGSDSKLQWAKIYTHTHIFHMVSFQLPSWGTITTTVGSPDNEYPGQVSIVAGQAEIQLGGIVVCQNPGEHRILAQVVISPSCVSEKQHSF